MSDSRIFTVIHSPGKVVIDPYEVLQEHSMADFSILMFINPHLLS